MKKEKLELRIITFVRDAGNVGQRLQNLALQMFLQKNFNCNIYTYDTRNFLHRITYGNTVYTSFYEFEKKYLNFKKIQSYDSILNEENDIDYFIVGSDMVFSEKNIKDEEKYFTLSFIKNNDKKISYAANANFSNDSKIIEEISKFKALSFREEFDQFQIFKNSQYNIDPTLLIEIDNWKQIENKKDFIKQPYSYDCYYLVHSNSKKQFDLTNKIDIYGIEPDKWLYIIDKCNTCYTDSYHGLIFSLLFNKKVVFPKNILNSKLFKLINSFGLIYNQFQNTFENNHYFKYIIEKQKCKSLEYFKNCFKI